MPELQVKREPLGIEDCSFSEDEEGTVRRPPPAREFDVRQFLLSVTGSQFLAYGEMLLR